MILSVSEVGIKFLTKREIDIQLMLRVYHVEYLIIKMKYTSREKTKKNIFHEIIFYF